MTKVDILLPMMPHRRINRRFCAFTAAAACFASIGCSDKSEQSSATTEVATPATDQEARAGGTPFAHAAWQPSADSTRIVSHGLEFTKPATWIETPPVTSLREGNYTIPGISKSPGKPGSDAAELVLFSMNTEEAITLDAHVERWLQQFAPNDEGQRPIPKIDTLAVGDWTIPIVELRGSYVRSGSAWYTPGQVMIAAILNVADDSDATGNGQLLIRLAGPAATVDSNRDTFLALIGSARPLHAPMPTESAP